MSEPLYQTRSTTAARLPGFGSFAAGAAMICRLGVLPLLGAIREKPLAEYSIKPIIPGGFLVVMGLFRIVRGLAGYTAPREMQWNPRAMKRLGIISVIAPLLSRGLLDHVFESYGDFRSRF